MATILRVAHDRAPFAVIDRRMLEDDRLSWAARGVLGYLLAKPNDWQLRIEDLRRRGDLGRDALYRVLKQLRALGYVERKLIRDNKGRILEVEYLVHEVPRTVCPFPGYPDPDEPDTGEPDPGEPDPAQPDPAEPTLLNKKVTKEPVNQVTTTTPAADEGVEQTAAHGGGGWIFPPSFSKSERSQAAAKLEGLGEALGQALLDELAGRLRTGALRGPPLAYLRGLIRRARAGEFTPEAGLAIAEARTRRERHQKELEARQAMRPPLPPVDPSHPLAKRIAQIRDRMPREPTSCSPDDGET